MTSFLKELRAAAARCPDVLIRKIVKDAADMLQHRIARVYDCPTKEAMIELNAAWVCAVKALEKAVPTPETPPRSGAGEVEQERMAA